MKLESQKFGTMLFDKRNFNYKTLKLIKCSYFKLKEIFKNYLIHNEN